MSQQDATAFLASLDIKKTIASAKGATLKLGDLFRVFMKKSK